MFMYFSFFVLLFFFGVNLTIGQVIEECLSRYEPSEVCVSFNGGKDCSALLHLIHAAWIRRRSSFVSTDRLRLRALYIRGQDPFPEMEQFIEDTRQRQLFFWFCFLYHRIYFYNTINSVPSLLPFLFPSDYPGHFLSFFFFMSSALLAAASFAFTLSLLYPPSCQSLTLIDPIHFARTPPPPLPFFS